MTSLSHEFPAIYTGPECYHVLNVPVPAVIEPKVVGARGVGVSVKV
jgi:hypothetical protein